MSSEDSQRQTDPILGSGGRDVETSGGPPDGARSATRTYSRPRLVSYGPCLVSHGTLAEVTQFGGSVMLDSGGSLGDQV
jgi:hypothetical protein